MRKVIVLSGVSGSGKSTLAQGLLTDLEKGRGFDFDDNLPPDSIAVVSANLFFETPAGYRFDPSKLSQAHGACFKEFLSALAKERELVIVDNTNTTSEEIAPYMLGAQAFGYNAEIQTFVSRALPHERHWYEVEQEYVSRCTKRNTHGVDFQIVAQQYHRILMRKL